ncbi:hypothetical protein ACFOSC_10995 [Streptantibioticus rubrisoli]|uniref:hypothetical protein n=1 Tax=Streptantibioticus rubrisoli TaxID=1387313 RepID=UPI00355790EF
MEATVERTGRLDNPYKVVERAGPTGRVNGQAAAVGPQRGMVGDALDGCGIQVVAVRGVELDQLDPHLDLDGIERRHSAHCRGLGDSGAAIRILDWTAYAALWPFHLVDRR